jgi:splicing factor 4
LPYCVYVLYDLIYFRGNVSVEGRGIGIDRPATLDKDDDEYDAYRKRMMLAYRFRPNPLVGVKI